MGREWNRIPSDWNLSSSSAASASIDDCPIRLPGIVLKQIRILNYDNILAENAHYFPGCHQSRHLCKFSISKMETIIISACSIV